MGTASYQGPEIKIQTKLFGVRVERFKPPYDHDRYDDRVFYDVSAQY